MRRQSHTVIQPTAGLRYPTLCVENDTGDVFVANNAQPPDIPYGYMIGDSGENMGKLIVATFNIP